MYILLLLAVNKSKEKEISYTHKPWQILHVSHLNSDQNRGGKHYCGDGESEDS